MCRSGGSWASASGPRSQLRGVGSARAGDPSCIRSSRFLALSHSRHTPRHTDSMVKVCRLPPIRSGSVVDGLALESHMISPLLNRLSVFATVLTLAALRIQVLCILYVGGKHAEEEKRLLGTVSRENGSSEALSFISHAFARRWPIHSPPLHDH